MPQQWTIDSIAHALPHAENRQAFWRDVNLTPVDKLPATLARWQRFVEEWEAAKPGLNALLQHAKEHDGELPPEYQETPESRAAFEEWENRMRAVRDGRSAA